MQFPGQPDTHTQTEEDKEWRQGRANEWQEAKAISKHRNSSPGNLYL